MRHLFLGGPLDQQWREVPQGAATVVAQESAGTLGDTGRIVHYYRTQTHVPGAWTVLLTMFRSDPVLPPDHGTAMPGWIEGQRPECTPIGAWQWIDATWGESARALHNAIRARRYRA